MDGRVDLYPLYELRHMVLEFYQLVLTSGWNLDLRMSFVYSLEIVKVGIFIIYMPKTCKAKVHAVVRHATLLIVCRCTSVGLGVPLKNNG